MAAHIFMTGRRVKAGHSSQLLRRSLIGLAGVTTGLALVLPVLVIFSAALSHGFGVYVASIFTAETWQALRLTLFTVALVVPLNAACALALAWAVSKTRVRGSTWLLVATDLPLTVSPVVTGLMLILLYGQRGWLATQLHALGIDIAIVYAVPAVVLATLFVTVPYVAKQILPQLEDAGTEAEEAAATLGASGWSIFRRVTLPSIKLSLVQGIILAATRAAGEFGAVSMISGHIRGLTTTLPQQVEILYNEYRFTAAYSVASILTLFAVLSLGVKAYFTSSLVSAPVPQAINVDDQSAKGRR